MRRCVDVYMCLCVKDDRMLMPDIASTALGRIEQITYKYASTAFTYIRIYTFTQIRIHLLCNGTDHIEGDRRTRLPDAADSNL